MPAPLEVRRATHVGCPFCFLSAVSLGIKEFPKSFFEGIKVCRLAIPDRQDAPAHLLECFDTLRIAFAVAGKFGLPIVSIGLGKPNTRASVHVPEAAVDEDDRLPARERKVRFPG